MEDARIVRGRREPEKQAQAIRLRREMAFSEAALWQQLRAHRLDDLHFRRQQIIDGFIADFYCHAARLVIELDGQVHDSQKEYDAERDRIIAARSLCVLRIPNDRLEVDMPGVLKEIRNIANQRLPKDSESPSPPGGGVGEGSPNEVGKGSSL